MAYKGKYKPRRPYKYKGDPTNIIYRSLWERKFMQYCDDSLNILEWGSEEIALPYRSPVDNRVHRYFPDFVIKTIKDKKYMIEIKPSRQTVKPKKPKLKTKSYMRESFNYIKNKAKWSAARAYCVNNNMEFKLITEKQLGFK